MKTFIALLRGINVGGHKKVPMAELRQHLTKAGLKEVSTYIQSGNVIFKSPLEQKELEDIISKCISDHFGFEVPVLIKTAEEIRNIIDKCPFSKEKIEAAYFTIFSKAPDKSSLEEARLKTYPGEELVLTSDCIYYFSDMGFGKSKYDVSFFERKLKITTTTRNYRTMMKLVSLSADKSAS